MVNTIAKKYNKNIINDNKLSLPIFSVRKNKFVNRYNFKFDDSQDFPPQKNNILKNKKAVKSL